MRYTRLKHQFVTHLPAPLEPGVLYISIEYATVAHLCCCGCGTEVVTPLTPTDWKMTFDGESISLWPSVGNWNDACRSHYVIERGQVIAAPAWSDQRIEAEWWRDRAAKERHFAMRGESRTDGLATPTPVETKIPWWSRIRKLFG